MATLSTLKPLMKLWRLAVVPPQPSIICGIFAALTSCSLGSCQTDKIRPTTCTMSSIGTGYMTKS